MAAEALYRWRMCRRFSEFFSDLGGWLKAAPAPALAQEYDELFKGVHAGKYIPLWASACKGRGDILLDETTLGVIRFYRRHGYREIPMDGNPPDYIGQQFRFLAHLWACAMHRPDAEKCAEAAGEFVSLYLLDTVSAVAAGIESCSGNPLLLSVAGEMRSFLRGDTAFTWTGAEQAEAEKIFSASEFCALGRNGLPDEIPLGEARTVNTAGRNNCGGKCIIRVTVREGCVLAVGSDPGGEGVPLRACVRGRNYSRTYLTGHRLRYPMRRVGKRGEGRFKRISWEEAAKLAAERWISIRDRYGAGSRYVNYATGVSAAVSPAKLARRLLSLDGGYLDYYNSYSCACTMYATPYIYGDNYSGNSMEDVLNTGLLILWGHNPVETIFGSQRNYYLAGAKKNGLRVIVIDPRQSDSAIALADEWIGLRPGTDSALADAMAYVIVKENLHDQSFLDKYCLGFDEAHMPEGIPENQSYEAYLSGKQDGLEKTPEWACKITGVPADVIIRIAREYAAAKPACLMPGYGMQRTGNGEQSTRSLALLACLTGNVGIPGGGAAGMGLVPGRKCPALPIPPNPFPGSIPCFLWTRAIESGVTMTKLEDGLEGVERLESNIKMMFNLAGNVLVNQHSDINGTIRVLEDESLCEFILCSDVFMTPSARFADLLLPAPSFLEDDNISPPWDDFGQYLLYNNKAVEPLFGCRSEYAFLRDVAGRLGLREAWEDGRDGLSGWLEHLYDSARAQEPELPDYETFKREGRYIYKENPHIVAYADQIRDPAGHPFATPSGKIEIFSPRLYAMEPQLIPAIPKYTPCPEGSEDALAGTYPLQLIGWHTRRRCHSIHDNNAWLEEAEPQAVWIHPADAEKRGIAEGDQAEIWNGRGRIRMPAHVTKRVVKGVVAIAQGAWYTPDASGTDIRGSINVLTAVTPTPLAKGNPQHTSLVEVSKAN